MSLAIAVPVEILSYSAAEEKHDHKMEGVPGEAVMGEFSFQVKSYNLVNCPALQPRSQAPDTGDAVYKLTYTADMDGFQAMGDHLPVSVILYTKAGFQIFVQVIMDPVPEVELPAMVDYTPEVGLVISLCLLISQFAGRCCQG